MLVCVCSSSSCSYLQADLQLRLQGLDLVFQQVFTAASLLWVGTEMTDCHALTCRRWKKKKPSCIKICVFSYAALASLYACCSTTAYPSKSRFSQMNKNMILNHVNFLIFSLFCFDSIKKKKSKKESKCSSSHTSITARGANEC